MSRRFESCTAPIAQPADAGRASDLTQSGLCVE
jgi:hypothetical protein